jgi:hypothetical protein
MRTADSEKIQVLVFPLQLPDRKKAPRLSFSLASSISSRSLLDTFSSQLDEPFWFWL